MIPIIFFAFCIFGCIMFLIGQYNGFYMGHEEGFLEGWDRGYYHSGRSPVSRHIFGEANDSYMGKTSPLVLDATNPRPE